VLSTTPDATTLPIRDGSAGWLGVRLRRGGERSRSDTAAAELVGKIAIGVIVALSLLVVVMAANRPSLLSPTTHIGFYPRWMAGPLGGLWPGLTGNSTTLKYWFSGSIVVMYASYVIALRHAALLPARWVIGAILAVHLIFLLSPPLALTDIFNYINYGRMEVVHNLNPYTSIPIVEPHSDPSFILSNWHELFSPYGPLFTMITFLVVPLGVAGSFWALKLLLAATSLATIWLVWKCAKLLGRDPVTAIVLVGCNPIVLVWGLGGDHNDFLLLVFIMLGFYLLLRAHDMRQTDDGTPETGVAHTLAGRLRGWLAPLSALEMGAGAALVVGCAIKASGAVLIPVVLIALLHKPRALVQVLLGMAVTAAIVGALSLLAFGLHIPDLSTQSRLVTSESVPNLIGMAIGSGGETEGLHTVMTGVLAISLLACCWMAWRKREPITASAWASVALLVTLSWVLPWYVLWVLPLAALSDSRRLRAATLAVGVYLIVAWAPASALLWNAIGFHPEKTAIGRLHQRAVKELLN
jgi:hypothetical protein